MTEKARDASQAAKARLPLPAASGAASGWMAKVRDLEWEPFASDGSTHKAKTNLAHYVVWEIGGRGYLSKAEGYPGQAQDGGIETAKAAAQADYARRILSALDIPPSGDGLDAGEDRLPRGVAGAAETAQAALKDARQFIINGIELGFIRMPDPETPDPAHGTLGKIDAALAMLEGKANG